MDRSTKVQGYVVVIRPLRRGGPPAVALEPALGEPEDLAIKGQSITLEAALKAFSPTREQLLAAFERAFAP